MKVVLGPGASRGAAGMKPYVDGLLRRGIDCETLELPRGAAERALPLFRRAVAEPRVTVAGGHSFGGRVASLAAAAGEPYAGLLLFSYPLHPPGRPEMWEERSAHWRSIECPALLISGDRDQFAGPELLGKAVPMLREGRLEVLQGAGHGFRGAELERALDIAARWLLSMSP
jgi:predicted alpha/beta-hydrolase family hydrolase